MTQDERWMTRYNEVKTFIEQNHRNPSKYVDAERGLRNWVKQQKKLMNAGALEGQRLRMFNELLALGERYKRVNQYELVFYRYLGEPRSQHFVTFSLAATLRRTSLPALSAFFACRDALYSLAVLL